MAKRGRSTALSPFPPLFGPYRWTELLVALHKRGPLRNLAVRSVLFDDRSIEKPKTNVARLVLSSSVPKRRFRFLNLNPRAYDIPEFIEVLERLAQCYPIRETPLPRHRAADSPPIIPRADAPEISVDAIFGSVVRTRILLTLHALGGTYSIGQLESSVLNIPYTHVRSTTYALAEEGLLLREGPTVRFNPEFACFESVLSLLDALIPQLPDITSNAHARHLVRATPNGTAHSDGIRHRLFGTRTAQAVLAYLAAYGPSRKLEICGAVASKDSLMAPLISKGLVCKVEENSNDTVHAFYSLNTGHPLYRQLRAILRTDQVMNQSFPVRPKRDLYEGEDLCSPPRDYLPYALCGKITENHTALVADILATLNHTEHRECEPAALARVLGEHDRNGIDSALGRLERQGILTSRWWKGLHLFRLDANYGAHRELVDLLVAMGRVWPEYREGGESEAESRSPKRAAMEPRSLGGDVTR